MFSVISPLNGGSSDTYGYPTESPFDLDAGLDYTRLSSTISPWPFPVVLGWADGWLPLMNSLEYSVMLGRVPSGAGIGQMSAPANIVFPNIQGGLMKVSG